ncbi:hypothetical protein MPOCJGCO_2937 [Methylobacterium trifolii]|uniref:Uncharacterized protein n=1 Tax=Methylobacterium trifolii TaxID=1003092 RepID=A0ABQ4U119_9HYPH|nr:hypothetical protein MPOCJGCO_2937 [Methylobacterium trifolii]
MSTRATSTRSSTEPRPFQGNRLKALALILASASVAGARLRGLRLILRSVFSRIGIPENSLRGALFAP